MNDYAKKNSKEKRRKRKRREEKKRACDEKCKTKPVEFYT